MITNGFWTLLVSISGHEASFGPLSSERGAPQYSPYDGYEGISKNIEMPNGRVSCVQLFLIT
jgi:hypothetical protein